MLLDDAIQTLVEHESTVEERPVTGRLTLADDGALQMGASRLRIGEQGLTRLCKRFVAPADYVKRLDPSVRQVLLQWHLDGAERDQEDVSIISRGEEFLGFGRRDLLRISGGEVLGAIQSSAKKELTVHDLRLSDESVQADLLLESAAEEVAPGDVLRAGLRVTHSLIGEHATWIESYILRLVCANGMTHRECGGRRAARTRRLPSNQQDSRQRQLFQVRRLAMDALATLDQKLRTIRSLQNETVDVDLMSSRWLERARLSARVWLPVVRRAWAVEGSQATAFGVMNAFTRVATHEPRLSARQRRILSGLAGLLAFQRIHLCPRCFAQLGGPAPHTENHEQAAAYVNA
jgi:hypothetical protein